MPAHASTATPRKQGIMPALPWLGVSWKPRKTKNSKNILILPSFCPHVLASEQVFKWHTPYSFIVILIWKLCFCHPISINYSTSLVKQWHRRCMRAGVPAFFILINTVTPFHCQRRARCQPLNCCLCYLSLTAQQEKCWAQWLTSGWLASTMDTRLQMHHGLGPIYCPRWRKELWGSLHRIYDGKNVAQLC